MSIEWGGMGKQNGSVVASTFCSIGVRSRLLNKPDDKAQVSVIGGAVITPGYGSIVEPGIPGCFTDPEESLKACGWYGVIGLF